MGFLKTDIGFAIVYRKGIVNKKRICLFKDAYRFNLKLFGKRPKKFRIILCDNETDLNRYMKYYYNRWATATVLQNNDFVMRSPEFIRKIGRWKQKDVPHIIMHEMNHVFWTEFYQTCKPCWLLEGLACYAGKNFLLSRKELKSIVIGNSISYSILEYRYLKRNWTRQPTLRYQIYSAFTRFLIKNYSSHNLIRLMDKFCKNHVRSNYDEVFFRIFKRTEKKLFEEFLEWARK